MSATLRRFCLITALIMSFSGVFLASRLHAQFQPRPFGPGGFGPGPGIGPGPGFGPNSGPKFPPFNQQPNNMKPGGMDSIFGGGPKFPSFEKQWVCSGCGASLGNGIRPAGMCAGCGAKIINGSGGPAGGNVRPGALNPGNAGPGFQNPPFANQPGAIPAIPPVGFNPQQNQLPQQAPADNAAPAQPEQPPKEQQQQQQQKVEMPQANFQVPNQVPAAAGNFFALYIVAAVLGTLLVIAIIVLVAAKTAGAF